MGRPRPAIAKGAYVGDRRDSLRNPRDIKELEEKRKKRLASIRKKRQ